MRLPQPMLAHPGRVDHLPAHRYAHEVKWDGFRAIVSVNGELSVRSRRGWDMTALVPELADMPVNAVLDGELVTFNEQGLPHFPLVCRRLLHGDRAVPSFSCASTCSGWMTRTR